MGWSRWSGGWGRGTGNRGGHRPAQPASRAARARARRGRRWGSDPSATPYAGRVALIGLDRPREVLYRRIDERAAWLFANGLLDEVRALHAAGFGPELRPMTGHGYAEAAAHLAGEWTLERAVEVTARRTRQYAKRQLTWFRRDPRLLWLPAGEGPADEPPVVEQAERVLRAALS